MENKKEKSFIILAGLGLIILVGAITISRQYVGKFFQKEEAEEVVNDFNIEKINLLNPEQLFQQIEQQRSPIIIDVRSSDEYEIEHILKSKNINNDSTLLSKENLLVKENYVIVDSNITPIGKELIKGLDYPENIFYLVGGFDAWKEHFYPTISIGDPESFVDRSKTTGISSEELKNILIENQSIVLVDIRTKEEFENEHLKGAFNIPLDEIENLYSEIPFGENFIVYANNTFEAFQGSVRLYDLSFFNVSYLEESFQNIKNNGLEIEPQKNPE